EPTQTSRSRSTKAPATHSTIRTRSGTRPIPRPERGVAPRRSLPRTSEHAEGRALLVLEELSPQLVEPPLELLHRTIAAATRILRPGQESRRWEGLRARRGGGRRNRDRRPARSIRRIGGRVVTRRQQRERPHCSEWHPDDQSDDPGPLPPAPPQLCARRW